MFRRCFTVLVFSVLANKVHAQGPNEGFVMQAEATRHVSKHVDPVYPPIAKAARVQGAVLIHADVDETGHVTKVEAIGGPLMLKQAAIDAVKQWEYTPFQVDGKNAPVKIVISVPFSLGIPVTVKDDQSIGQAYFPKAEECRNVLAAGAWLQALDSCHDANEIAARFPSQSDRANEVRLAHEDYGRALAFSKQLPDALVQFDSAVEVAEKSLTPKDSEYADAYFWKAFAEHASGMRAEADADYSVAEKSYRLAMVKLADMKTIYGRELAHALAYHSVLAQQLGHDDEAVKMQDEAKTVDPKVLLPNDAKVKN